MAFEDQTKKVVLIPSPDGQTRFYFPFPVGGSSEVKVVYTDPDGVESTPTFTVGSDDFNYGGYIDTDTSYTNGKITISREPAIKQLLEYVFGDELPLTDQAETWDSIVRMCLYFDEIVNRGAYAQNIEEVDMELNSARSRAGANLLTDSNGIPYGGGLLDSSITPSVFGDNFMHIDTIEEFLTQLGISSYAQSLLRLTTYDDIFEELELGEAESIVEDSTLFLGDSQEEAAEEIMQNFIRFITPAENVSKGDPLSFYFGEWRKIGFGALGSAVTMSSDYSDYLDLCFLDEKTFIVAWHYVEDTTYGIRMQACELGSSGITKSGSILEHSNGSWSSVVTVKIARISETRAVVIGMDYSGNSDYRVIEYTGEGLSDKAGGTQPYEYNIVCRVHADDTFLITDNGGYQVLSYDPDSETISWEVERSTVYSGWANGRKNRAANEGDFVILAEEATNDIKLHAIEFDGTNHYAAAVQDGGSNDITTNAEGGDASFSICYAGGGSFVIAYVHDTWHSVIVHRVYFVRNDDASYNFFRIEKTANDSEWTVGQSVGSGHCDIVPLGREYFVVIYDAPDSTKICYRLIYFEGHKPLPLSPEYQTDVGNNYLKAGGFGGSWAFAYEDASSEVSAIAGALRKYVATADENITSGTSGRVRFKGVIDGYSSKAIGDAYIDYVGEEFNDKRANEIVGRFLTNSKLMLT